jgi:chromosome segregation ATPase
MADEGTSAQLDIAPETTGLAKQVESLIKERDTLISDRDGSKARAQKRWAEAQHAQAEMRRVTADKKKLQDRILALERLYASYQVTIDELKDTMDQKKEKIRKELQEKMLKTYNTAVQQVQAEYEGKLAVSSKAATGLLQQVRQVNAEKVTVAEQAERKSTEAAVAAVNELRKLREENAKKDREIAFMKREIQDKSEVIEALRNPPAERYTPKQKSPDKTSTRAPNRDRLFK